jgi:hypothetical protein
MGGGRHWKQPATAPQTLPYEAWPECHVYPIPTIGGSTDIGPGSPSGWMKSGHDRLDISHSKFVRQPHFWFLGQKEGLPKGGTVYAAKNQNFYEPNQESKRGRNFRGISIGGDDTCRRTTF